MHDQQNGKAHGDHQQGTGGLGSGQATSTPGQNGRQPHLGSQPDAGSAAGGTGLSESDSMAGSPAVDRIGQAGRADPGGAADTQAAAPDRLDDIERADDRTPQSSRERQRDIGAQTPGDPGDLLSQPLGDGNYRKQGDEQIPLSGNPDPVTGG